MHYLPVLKPGDHVEIIAPASRCSNQQLTELIQCLSSWQLTCYVDERIFGEDLFGANTDELRFKQLSAALQRPNTQALICARGGYGSMRLIPELTKIHPPTLPKLFVGMSDITALHLYLQQQWNWPTLHAATVLSHLSSASVSALKSILFGNSDPVVFQGLPLNAHAATDHTIQSSICGGNLSLVQTSIGTLWQLNGRGKIILLEEVSERGYRVDRMLEHLRQASIFEEAQAIVFGDFTEGNEPDGSSLIGPVLERFAHFCSIPVIQVSGIGHGHNSLPIPLGTMTTIELGSNISITCHRRAA